MRHNHEAMRQRMSDQPVIGHLKKGRDSRRLIALACGPSAHAGRGLRRNGTEKLCKGRLSFAAR